MSLTINSNIVRPVGGTERTPQMRRRVTRGVAIVALLGLLTACGGGSTASANQRTVRIALRQLKFSPDTLTVKAGTTVKFILENADAIDHEFVLGTEEVQQEHAAMSAEGNMNEGTASPGDNMSEANSTTVAAGKTVEFTYAFRDAGTLIYGCHVMGHYGQGMKGTVTIEA